jgi:hypothetical protein
MGAGNTPKYNPSKLSANEAMGFNAGKTRYQMNTPAGLYTLATLGMGPGAIPAMGEDMAGQHKVQKQLRGLKPGYEQQAESQGLQARQQSIASGTGGGGVQTSADTQAYNSVMAQYAALRQALEMQRLQQQMQMYGTIAQVAGSFYNPGGAGAMGGMQPQSQGMNNRPTRGIGAGGVY